MLPNERIDPLFYAVTEATEEAIVNAWWPPRPWPGGGTTAHRLPHDRLLGVMPRYRPGPGR